jgi:hypothetical protein
MKLENLPLIDITDCYNKTDIAKKLNLPLNGKSLNLIKRYIELHTLSTVHFDKQHKNRVYQKIIKTCPVCNNEFETSEGISKEKQTCSYSCSNTYFRSGINNPNFKEDSISAHRTICFHYHKKQCIICEESNIVEAHHYNKNHEDNRPENLVPLCPTHHQYVHSQYEHLVSKQIDDYVTKFKYGPS